MKKTKMPKTPRPARVMKLEHIEPARQSMLALISFLIVVTVLGVLARDRNAIYQSTLSLWKSIVESAPNKRRAHENYGQALSTAGSVARSADEAKKYYDEALKQFQTVIDLRDDGSVPLRDLYREIGVVQFRLEKFNEAISTWQTGLRHAPGDPSLLNNLSIALMQQGRLEEAASAASLALVADANMPQALNTLGQVYMAKNDSEKAVLYFQKALEREPDTPARYWNLALAYERARRYDQALRFAQQYGAMERDSLGRQRAVELQEHIKRMTGK